jgi:hypothetical protein
MLEQEAMSATPLQSPEVVVVEVTVFVVLVDVVVLVMVVVVVRHPHTTGQNAPKPRAGPQNKTSISSKLVGQVGA